MSITKQVTLPTGEVRSYHRQIHGELNFEENVFTATVGSWESRDDFLLQKPAVRTAFELPFSAVATVEPTLVDDTLGLFFGGVVLAEGAEVSLESAIAIKTVEINTARLAATYSWFPYASKVIACDQLSRSDIDGANGIISLTGVLPPGWPGAWKAMDNTYVVIPDVATWTAFYGAMVAQGTANFLHAQALKAYMNDPVRTQEQVQAIHWGMVL